MPALTMKALRGRLDYDVGHAERSLLADGHVAPLFAVTGADGNTIPIAADFSDATAKANTFNIVRLVCIAEDATLVVHRTEAWLAPGDIPEGLLPSQSDRRVEVVLVILAGRVGGEIRRLRSIREIVRGMDGKPVGLRALALPGSKGQAPDLIGPAAELIPPKRPNDGERALARALLARIQSGGAPPSS